MRTTNQAIALAVSLTQWCLGAIIVLGLAFGGGLWSANARISALKQELAQTNYILAVALGLVPGGMKSEDGSNYRTAPQTRTVAAEVAVAEADSVARGAGADPARGGGSIAQTKGELHVSF